MTTADEFVKAVANGARVFAHPRTAELMKEFIGPIESSDLIEEGVLFAMDESKFFPEISSNLGMRYTAYDNSSRENKTFHFTTSRYSRRSCSEDKKGTA